MSILNEYLKIIPPTQHGLVRALDEVITSAAPGLTSSLKWGNLTYSGVSNVCSIVAHTHHINLQFFKGVHLADPRGLLSGTGIEMRHIKISSESDVDPDYIKVLVRDAAKSTT
ncbi:MAG: DUF1801 domain-containing protein [Candidatus Kapabacteria bacterium]|nr:DUF1801 domain-containing protein [Candidatus Kapabacteria bacterium]